MVAIGIFIDLLLWLAILVYFAYRLGYKEASVKRAVTVAEAQGLLVLVANGMVLKATVQDCRIVKRGSRLL